MLNLNFSAADFQEIRTGITPGARGLDLTTGGEGSMREASPEKEKPLIFRVFTDGSCFNNGKKNSTGGIGIHFPDHQLEDVSAPYYGQSPGSTKGKVTNQRAELTAIYQALLLMNDYVDGLSQDGTGLPLVHFHVYTDSEYCINSLTNWCYAWRANNWRTAKGKPAKNRDIIEPLLALMKRRRVLFFHAEAHTERDDERSRGNARADFLATQATKRQQLVQTRK